MRLGKMEGFYVKCEWTPGRTEGGKEHPGHWAYTIVGSPEAVLHQNAMYPWSRGRPVKLYYVSLEDKRVAPYDIPREMTLSWNDDPNAASPLY